MSELTDVRERQERAARNQSLFRQVNERIGSLNEAFTDLLPIGDWVCECADDTCVERIGLTTRDYEAVRAHGTHFIVAPGHVLTEAERVVEKSDRYWVVEKIEAAAEVAAEADPRDHQRSPRG